MHSSSSCLASSSVIVCRVANVLRRSSLLVVAVAGVSSLLLPLPPFRPGCCSTWPGLGVALERHLNILNEDEEDDEEDEFVQCCCCEAEAEDEEIGVVSLSELSSFRMEWGSWFFAGGGETGEVGGGGT